MKLVDEIVFTTKALAKMPFYLISGTYFFSKAYRSKAIHDKLVNEKQLLEIIKSDEHHISDEDKKAINDFIRKYKHTRY